MTTLKYPVRPLMARVSGWSAMTAPASLGPSDWFDADQHLGKRGHKYLSHGTRYWLATTSKLAALSEGQGSPDRLGVVVGTNFGAHTTLRDLHKVARESGSSSLSPLGAPNFCVNLIASHAGIKYKARRFNLTLTTPQVAGLDALAAAAIELSLGRCDSVVAGAAEESLDCAALESSRHQGAIALLLSPADRAPGSGDGTLLSGFFEGHIPVAAGWQDGMRVLAKRLARHFQGSQWVGPRPQPRRVLIVSDCSSVFPRLQELLSLAGVHGQTIEYRALVPGHGCLEPLDALHELFGDAEPAVFAYASTRGAVRCLLLNESYSFEAATAA